MAEYRIRWANVIVAGRHPRVARMCIAERKHWLGWWPLSHVDWRTTEEQAMGDIIYDRKLREPLPSPRVVVDA